MTPTATAAPLDLTYTISEAREARDWMRNRQDDLNIDSGMFTEVDWAQIDLIYPILRNIETTHDCTILVAQSHSTSEMNPDALRNIAGIAAGSRTVIIARHGYLTQNVASRQAASVDDHPALQGLHVEANPGYYREYALNGQTLGLIAPNVICANWWWYNGESSPTQLPEMFHTLQDAVTSALDPAFAQEWADGGDQRIASHIAHLISARGSEQLSSMRNEVPRLLRDIVNYERQINTWQTRLDELRPLITAAEGALIQENDLAATVSTELNQLRAHPDVAGVEQGSGNTLNITTKQLPLTNIITDETAIAGTFDLRITFGNNANIRVSNITHAVGLYDHPHVSEGTFCLGDQRRLVESLIIRSELSAAVALVIDLLKQVNPDDTYTSDWEAWFQLNPEGAS
jgi:hypothetical protein